MAWKDVDLEKGTIHLRETKTGVERYVQLSTQAIDFLKVSASTRTPTFSLLHEQDDQSSKSI
jgi:integrase